MAVFTTPTSVAIAIAAVSYADVSSVDRYQRLSRETQERTKGNAAAKRKAGTARASKQLESDFVIADNVLDARLTSAINDEFGGADNIQPVDLVWSRLLLDEKYRNQRISSLKKGDIISISIGERCETMLNDIFNHSREMEFAVPKKRASSKKRK